VRERIADASEVVRVFRDDIPPVLAERARCVAVVPSLIRGGLILAARTGKGFALCRTATGWSAPAPIALYGGSAGFLAGLESADLVMLVMTEAGMRKLLSAKFELGSDVSVAAGPVGRGREAATDATLHAEILSYSRARGLFAGAQISGLAISQDQDVTQVLYGEHTDFRSLLEGRKGWPAEAQPLVERLGSSFPGAPEKK
jgi:lipid-binding SYLF domain-containing protein